MKPFYCILFAGALAHTVFGREPLRAPADLQDLQTKVRAVSAQVLPATVALISDQTGSSGSGVITSDDGLILTAAHVVQGAEKMLVVFPDGKQTEGTVLGANYSKDIAMVRLDAKQKWPFVTLGESKSLQAGDWVIALGHSKGFDAARTPPVRFGRVISRGPGNFVTTDCTLIGGDSGGPLFDAQGRLVAIHSSIGKSLANNNHAGIDGFREDWERMLAGDTWGELSLNPFANPEMPVLGIVMGLNRRVHGVVVEKVVPRSPAAAAGIRTGDLIVSMEESPIRDGGELLRLLAKRQAGDKVKVELLRENREQEVTVTLKRMNELFEE
jgi:serine protease Do